MKKIFIKWSLFVLTTISLLLIQGKVFSAEPKTIDEKKIEKMTEKEFIGSMNNIINTIEKNDNPVDKNGEPSNQDVDLACFLLNYNLHIKDKETPTPSPNIFFDACFNIFKCRAKAAKINFKETTWVAIKNKTKPFISFDDSDDIIWNIQKNYRYKNKLFDFLWETNRHLRTYLETERKGIDLVEISSPTLETERKGIDLVKSSPTGLPKNLDFITSEMPLDIVYNILSEVSKLDDFDQQEALEKAYSQLTNNYKKHEYVALLFFILAKEVQKNIPLKERTGPRPYLIANVASTFYRFITAFPNHRKHAILNEYFSTIDNFLDEKEFVKETL